MIYKRFGCSLPEDKYNIRKIRKVNNTDKFEYNCGGYALETFSWYSPVFKTDSDDKCLFTDKQLNHYINVILKEIENIRVINSIEDLLENEYAIAFRTANDIFEQDFHFMKRAKNGCWYEKRGSEPFIRRVPKEKVFAEHWNTRYFGKIILFAKKV